MKIPRRQSSPGRCQSWRRSAKPHDPLHRPGECHKCWRPCRQRLEDHGELRCAACIDELVHAPETWVRLGLISEPAPSKAVIDVLVGDGDFTVSYTARWQRAHQGATSDLPLVPAATLRDTLVASARREPELDESMTPRHDSDENDW